jgi:hypothetical protein
MAAAAAAAAPLDQAVYAGIQAILGYTRTNSVNLSRVLCQFIGLQDAATPGVISLTGLETALGFGLEPLHDDVVDSVLRLDAHMTHIAMCAAALARLIENSSIHIVNDVNDLRASTYGPTVDMLVKATAASTSDVVVASTSGAPTVPSPLAIDPDMMQS